MVIIWAIPMCRDGLMDTLPADRRDRLERLCRYVLLAPRAEGRKPGLCSRLCPEFDSSIGMNWWFSIGVS